MQLHTCRKQTASHTHTFPHPQHSISIWLTYSLQHGRFPAAKLWQWARTHLHEAELVLWWWLVSQAITNFINPAVTDFCFSTAFNHLPTCQLNCIKDSNSDQIKSSEMDYRYINVTEPIWPAVNRKSAISNLTTTSLWEEPHAEQVHKCVL